MERKLKKEKEKQGGEEESTLIFTTQRDEAEGGEARV